MSMDNDIFQNKKVAIAGFGVEGKSSYAYFSAQDADITIFDEMENITDTPKGSKVVTGPNVFNDLYGFDIVCRSPSVNPSRIKTDGQITSATKIFFDNCPCKIIGVTGTKGKGTTVSLIDLMLKEAGIKSHLLGNIGTSALDLLNDIEPNDVVVYEMSSFQLWDLDKSPQIAVVLMIESEHLDIHDDLEQYLDAKANISRYQNEDDITFYHPENKYSQSVANHGKGNKVKYLSSEACNVDNGQILIDNQDIINTNEIGLIGQHNLENVCAAVSVVWQITKDVEAIYNVLNTFKGLEHRLEFVRDVKGVKFYNDTFSTNLSATIAAVKSFEEPIVLLLGGYDRGQVFDSLVDELLISNVRQIVTMGETGPRLADQLIKAGFEKSNIYEANNFDESFSQALNSAKPGEVILLSPGCPSFDWFKNYKERGVIFKNKVQNL